MSSKFLDDRGKSLEDEFFHKENQKDLAKYRDKLAKQATKDDLRAASGMEDEEVLDKLVEMGLTADTVTALSLVPLIKVAWADGEVQDNEREAILQGARGKGIEADSPGAELLDGWLRQEPPKALFDAWESYVLTLRSELTAEQSKILRNQVTRFALAVAEAAGGFLGFRTVSGEEKETLEWIESVFEKVVESKASEPSADADDSDDSGADAAEDSGDDDSAAAADDSGDGDSAAAAEDSADEDKAAAADSGDSSSK